MTDLEQTNDMLLKIGAKFRILRRKAGATQQEVSKATGLNIGNIEAARSNMNVTTLELLCSYYGVTLEEFFDGLE